MWPHNGGRCLYQENRKDRRARTDFSRNPDYIDQWVEHYFHYRWICIDLELTTVTDVVELLHTTVDILQGPDTGNLLYVDKEEEFRIGFKSYRKQFEEIMNLIVLKYINSILDPNLIAWTIIIIIIIMIWNLDYESKLFPNILEN